MVGVITVDSWSVKGDYGWFLKNIQNILLNNIVLLAFSNQSLKQFCLNNTLDNCNKHTGFPPQRAHSLKDYLHSSQVGLSSWGS